MIYSDSSDIIKQLLELQVELHVKEECEERLQENIEILKPRFEKVNHIFNSKADFWAKQGVLRTGLLVNGTQRKITRSTKEKFEAASDGRTNAYADEVNDLAFVLPAQP